MKILLGGNIAKLKLIPIPQNPNQEGKKVRVKEKSEVQLYTSNARTISPAPATYTSYCVFLSYEYPNPVFSHHRYKLILQTVNKPLNLQGPLCLRKQRQPCCWSKGIIPPPLDVSMASIMETTSSISGRLSGVASQHFFITFARELGQHLGISGLKF